MAIHLGLSEVNRHTSGLVRPVEAAARDAFVRRAATSSSDLPLFRRRQRRTSRSPEM
jgi:hypothetical protein